LGMLRTSYDPFDPHAHGYSVAPYTSVLAPEPATDTRAMAPAGQVWSTALDLATYADFLIAGHRDVLEETALEEMTTPQTGSVAGYHHGEHLQVVRRADGSVDHLVCSTFVLTREPYGPVNEPG